MPIWLQIASSCTGVLGFALGVLNAVFYVRDKSRRVKIEITWIGGMFVAGVRRPCPKGIMITATNVGHVPVYLSVPYFEEKNGTKHAVLNEPSQPLTAPLGPGASMCWMCAYDHDLAELAGTFGGVLRAIVNDSTGSKFFSNRFRISRDVASEFVPVGGRSGPLKPRATTTSR